MVTGREDAWQDAFLKLRKIIFQPKAEITLQHKANRLPQVSGGRRTYFSSTTSAACKPFQQESSSDSRRQTSTVWLASKSSISRLSLASKTSIHCSCSTNVHTSSLVLPTHLLSNLSLRPQGKLPPRWRLTNLYCFALPVSSWFLCWVVPADLGNLSFLVCVTNVCPLSHLAAFFFTRGRRCPSLNHV